MRRVFRLAACATLAAVLLSAGAAVAQEPAGAPPPGTQLIIGSWVGARLLCQKDEGKLVRCGTPAPFAITFEQDGTGSSPDETFPKPFKWRWLSAQEIVVTPAGGGTELKLFSVERDAEMLTFQAYIFLPTSDPNAPVEARYLHYVFDVSLAE